MNALDTRVLEAAAIINEANALGYCVLIVPTRWERGFVSTCGLVLFPLDPARRGPNQYARLADVPPQFTQRFMAHREDVARLLASAAR